LRIIPTSVHGILDYLVGIALFFAPELFGFAEYGGAAVSVPRTLGVIVIVYSLLTRYEWGLVKAIPMGLHLMLDMLGGAFLAASPWIFGFNNAPNNVWMPHLVVGLAEIAIAAMTSPAPRRVTGDTTGATTRV
jgi:hypothetical protein